jgi:hypothetical protein
MVDRPLFPNRIDAEFFAHRRLPPSMRQLIRDPSIHGVVNSHALSGREHYNTSNSMHLLAMKRKRGEYLPEELLVWASSSTAPGRKALARRFLRKMVATGVLSPALHEIARDCERVEKYRDRERYGQPPRKDL